MIVGVVSDTHGSAARARCAVRLLRRLGAEALIHCGDVGCQQVIDALAGLPAWFVWGNTDFADSALARHAAAIGVTPPTRVPTIIQLQRHTLAVFHGHETLFARLVEQLRRQAFEDAEQIVAAGAYVLYGHTHQANDERLGPLRFVNPGALHRAASYSVATIDLSRDEVAHWLVEEAAPEDAEPRRYRLNR